MVIIRNPYIRVSVGVSWEIIAATSPPTGTGYPGDIVLVFPEGADIPNVAKLEQVGVYNNLVVSDGNKYPENGIFLFGGTDGTPGESEILLVDKQNLRIDTNASKAVVNIDEMQIECDVYAWDIRDEKWVKFEYIELPIAVSDTLNIASWVSSGISAEDISIWDKLNLTETTSTYHNTGNHAFEEQLSILSWVSNGLDVTQLNIWTALNIVDSGTITKNDNPTPF